MPGAPAQLLAHGRTTVDPGSLILLAVTFGLLLTIVTRGRRQRREALDLQERLTVGAEVMTTAGLYATVAELPDDGTAVLETAPGQRSRWDRRVVARVISPEPAAATAATPEAAADGGSRAVTDTGTAAPTDRD